MNDQKFVKKLMAMGEERMTEVLNELMANEKVSATVARTLMRTQNLKATLDKNVALALSLVNQPTREDFDKLRKQVRSLERQIEDLADKVETLTNVAAKPAAAPRKRAPKAEA